SLLQPAFSLEKELSSLGVVRRRQLKGIIRSGRVTVDGEVVRNLKQEVASEAVLAIDGIEIDRVPPLLLKYHKPYDVISSMDEKGCQDLSDALPGQAAPWDENAVEEARLRLGRGRKAGSA
ncbi:rluB, partial [Symbiodinium sp. CCMP2456]